MRVISRAMFKSDGRHDVENIVEDLQSEKKRKILEWLSGDYKTRHEELTRATVKNSGLWFLKSPEFTSWVKLKAPRSLICLGIRSSVFLLFLTSSGSRQINFNVGALFGVTYLIGL